MCRSDNVRSAVEIQDDEVTVSVGERGKLVVLAGFRARVPVGWDPPGSNLPRPVLEHLLESADIARRRLDNASEPCTREGLELDRV